jgi:hypothetical protein
MTKNWIEWHAQYDEPGSSLTRRLAVVRSAVATAINDAPPIDAARGPAGQLRIISMCAGDGRDVLPVAARSERGRGAHIVLVETDAKLCARARATARELSLPAVEVRCTDAGVLDSYLDIAPADVVLCCGVFGNVAIDDVRRTVVQLRSLIVGGGFAIWTRGRSAGATDPSLVVRNIFATNGFEEISFIAPDDAGYRVGVHRRPDGAPAAPPLRAGRLFQFVDQQLRRGR